MSTNRPSRVAVLLVLGLLASFFVAPGTAAAADPMTISQAELAMVDALNVDRTTRGLIPVRIDSRLMAIARSRSADMASKDYFSHTQPDGRNVFDIINAKKITWYGAGEIIAWNNYPTEYSAPEAIQAWMQSPGHRAIMTSTGYNYVGFGAAVSATGKRYYAGVFVKEPDETGAWTRFRTTSRTSLSRHRVRVTVRWSGADTRLQVLTSGLRYFEVQRRVVGGTWASWGTTTATHKTVTWRRPNDREVRVRARDRAGNWGPWKIVRINL
jgi:uncharacterized protein YkwD